MHLREDDPMISFPWRLRTSATRNVSLTLTFRQADLMHEYTPQTPVPLGNIQHFYLLLVDIKKLD